MTKLKKVHIDRYGCRYCTQVQFERYRAQYRYYCPHESCPYKELEKHKSYFAYLKAADNDGVLAALKAFG
jgi:hypothetical protein